MDIHDTKTAAMEQYAALLRQQPPHRRLAQCVALTKNVRALILAGIVAQFPNATDDELRARLTVRLYGSVFATTIFGTVPADAR